MKLAVRLPIVAIVAILAVTATRAPSWAGPEEDRKQATKLYQEGVALARDHKKYREAIVKLEQSLKLLPHPDTQHSLARAHEELGELETAYDYFTQALKQDYVFAADGRAGLARIETKLRTTHARLTVRTTPSQVTVVLRFPDGREQRFVQAPFATWAPAGQTRITGTNPSFKTRDETIELAAGEDRELALVLQPLPKQGFLQISVNIAGATITMAGQPIGKSPLPSLPYEAGVYQLEVRAKGHVPHVQEVIIVQDEVASINVSLEPDKAADPDPDDEAGGVPSWVGWTLIGAGAAAGGVAAYLQFGKAVPTQNEANDLPVPPVGTPDTEYDRLHDKAVDYQTAAIVTGIVGLALAGTGAVLLLTDGGDEPEREGARAPTFVPTFALTPTGGAIGGTFRF
ncbi:MAG: PEGA domain-containing protein [Deltaproteobacteria bacterium]|nr:PEGA domain-containing protein [Deltaproteobacteria bacterium]